MTCTTQSLVSSAKALQSIPEAMRGPVIIYLLQQIAGNAQTPSQLMAAAKGLRAIPEDHRRNVSNYLLCTIATQLGA